VVFLLNGDDQFATSCLLSLVNFCVTIIARTRSRSTLVLSDFDSTMSRRRGCLVLQFSFSGY